MRTLLLSSIGDPSVLLKGLWSNIPALVITAGTCFGIWPYLLMRGKISGMTALTAMVMVQVIMLFLVSGKRLAQWSEAVWFWIILAGIVSSAGMLCFLRIGEILPESGRGIPYSAVMMMQVAVFVTISIVQSEGITPTKIMGYTLIAGGMYGVYLLYTPPAS